MLALPGLCGGFYGLMQVVASYLCGKQEVWLLLGKGFTTLLAHGYLQGWNVELGFCLSLCWSCLHTYFNFFLCLLA